jgi:hypothetical protein
MAAHQVIPYLKTELRNNVDYVIIETYPLAYIRKEIEKPGLETIFHLFVYLDSVQEQHPGAGTVKENQLMLKNFFARTRDQQRQIQRWQNEADQISLYLAHQLCKDRPKEFTCAELEYIRNCPESLYNSLSGLIEGPVSAEYKRRILKSKMEILKIQTNDLIFAGRTIFFTTDMLGPMKMEVRNIFSWYYHSEDIYNSTLTKFESNPIILGPELFKRFCVKFGLTEMAVRWLYNLTDEVMAQVAQSIQKLENRAAAVISNATENKIDQLYAKLDLLNKRKKRMAGLNSPSW